MRLRQLINEASKLMSESTSSHSDGSLYEIARALCYLADNGSGEDIYKLLGAIRPLADYAKEAGI